MNFPEAVVAAHDWAVENNATVTITKVHGIDGFDGKIWSSFIIHTKGTAPGAFAKANQEITDFFQKMDEDFSFTVG